MVQMVDKLRYKMVYLYQKQGNRGNKEQRKHLTRYKEHDIISA